MQKKIAAAMKSVYKKSEMGADVYISKINSKGAKKIK